MLRISVSLILRHSCRLDRLQDFLENFSAQTADQNTEFLLNKRVDEDL